MRSDVERREGHRESRIVRTKDDHVILRTRERESGGRFDDDPLGRSPRGGAEDHHCERERKDPLEDALPDARGAGHRTYPVVCRPVDAHLTGDAVQAI